MRGDGASGTASVIVTIAMPMDAVLRDQVIAALAPGDGQHLYAVLDAARNGGVARILDMAGEAQRSLFDGAGAAALAPVAPYVVALGATQLSALVEAGWGKSWGIFVHSAAGFHHVREQLASLLTVSRGDGAALHFRYYDPRVARGFFAQLSPRQLSQVFAAIDAYLMEDVVPERLLRFAPLDGKVVRSRVALGT
jgi:hypothetical protein